MALGLRNSSGQHVQNGEDQLVNSQLSLQDVAVSLMCNNLKYL